MVVRYDNTFSLDLIAGLSESVDIIHLAIKDVNNDGLPEILLAVGDGFSTLSVGMWGFNQEGRRERLLSPESFSLLAELRGQNVARILEGGKILCPYGSVGFATAYRWDGSKFVQEEEE